MRIALATTVQPGLDHIGPLERHQTDITVLRRAEDLAELLAIARSGLVDAVLVAGDTESLTAAFLEETARLPRPVGVAALSEVRAERRRLRSMGVPCVRADADPEQIAAVVVESASAAAEGRRPETSHGEDADHARDHAEDLDDLPITLETLGADEVPGLTDPWRDADEPDDAGPGAAPAFPAAWPEVIAVTAVDADRAPYRQAARGPHVALAAPGVNLWTAASIEGGRLRSGTSYAAPFVSAALALGMARDGLSATDARDRLFRCAADLGAPGRDPVFGHGMVASPSACPEAGSQILSVSGE